MCNAYALQHCKLNQRRARPDSWGNIIMVVPHVDMMTLQVAATRPVQNGLQLTKQLLLHISSLAENTCAL